MEYYFCTSEDCYVLTYTDRLDPEDNEFYQRCPACDVVGVKLDEGL